MPDKSDGKPAAANTQQQQVNISSRDLITRQEYDKNLLNDKKYADIVDAAEKWHTNSDKVYSHKLTQQEKDDGMLKNTRRDRKDDFNFYKEHVLTQEVGDLQGNQTGLQALKNKYINQTTFDTNIGKVAKQNHVDPHTLKGTIENINLTTDAGKVYSPPGSPDYSTQIKQIYAEDRTKGFHGSRPNADAVLNESSFAQRNNAILNNAKIENGNVKFDDYKNSFKIRTDEEAFKAGERRQFGIFEKDKLQEKLPHAVIQPVEKINTEVKSPADSIKHIPDSIRNIPMAEIHAALAPATNSGHSIQNKDVHSHEHEGTAKPSASPAHTTTPHNAGASVHTGSGPHASGAVKGSGGGKGK